MQAKEELDSSIGNPMEHLVESIKLRIKYIYIETQAAAFPLVGKIINAIPEAEVIYLKEEEHSAKVHSPPLSNYRLIDQSKNSLLLSRSKGQTVKRCPGTKGMICCNYYVINLISNCPLECSYCILQGYINSPFIKIHVNIDEILEETKLLLQKHFPAYVRIGSGELSDSLALDHITGFSQKLVHFFARERNGFLELKTKTNLVEHLLPLDHRGKTVISWSLNPASVIATEEPFTSPLEDRLEAARKSQNAGYPLAIHFDPIFFQENWEKAYESLLNQMFTSVRPDRIAWISLGGFRYPGHLKEVIRQRFPESKMIYGELVPGPDGKYRYFKTIRREIYRKMVSWLKSYSSDLLIYFCMESPELWSRILGWRPGSAKELDARLSQRIQQLTS